MSSKTISPAVLAHREKFGNSSALLPETGFVRLNTILQIFPVGRSSWWAGVKNRRYPQPVKLSPRCTAWKAEDIRALLKQFDEVEG